jgi:DNA-binding transcriptional LysR family regulator
LQIISKAETALTLAALELAKVGLGVAWLPLALVGECVAEGKLADLSHRLGTAEVEIVASRLKGAKSPSEALLWDRLGEMVRTPEGR